MKFERSQNDFGDLFKCFAGVHLISSTNTIGHLHRITGIEDEFNGI